MITTLLATILLGSVDLHGCDIDGQQAECGVVQVPENRTTRQGRRIALNVVVIRHERGKRTGDAIFALAGGPGQNSARMAGFMSSSLPGVGRDIVLVDMRGTGQSNGLHCELGGSDTDVQGYFNDFLPIDRVAACREALEKRADLTQYTTRAAVEDLEDVRRALGYEKINLLGTSYGSRLAQEFMRHHPESVRMAVLRGVVSPSTISSVNFAADGQRSLDGVFALCAADAACRAAYPRLNADYEEMLRRIENGVEVSVEDPGTKRRKVLKINRGLFGEVFRNFLYSPDVYALAPYVVHRAAQGDFERFAQTALQYGRGIRTLDFGLFLSVTCTEDIPRLDLAAAGKAAEGTLLGAYRIEQQLAACKIWPRGEADPARLEPVRSSIPTLLISGELDPVTPPKYAEEVARTLSAATHVIAPRWSHADDEDGCLEKIVVRALRTGSVKNLDLACVDALRPPPFHVPQTSGTH